MLSTHSGDRRGSVGMRGVFEDVLDAVGEGFTGACSGDGGDGDQEEDGLDEFRFHGMRMLFVFCGLSLIGRFASLLLVYPSAPQLCVRLKHFFTPGPDLPEMGRKSAAARALCL